MSSRTDDERLMDEAVATSAEVGATRDVPVGEVQSNVRP